MRHPLGDLPSLLVMFGAIPKPLDESSCALGWDEWPQVRRLLTRVQRSSTQVFGEEWGDEGRSAETI
ncbi:hypothetical protein CLOM_g14483 [Closterium sp. NIES-68]|nr:hypothetical protein CLOM_g14483 [Closterium sp. NIES-68]GJP79467.1 hypothetical protein CLOP_g9699 [Closterium sp. NIES-67]